MAFETQIFPNDKIRLHILKDVLGGKLALQFRFDDGVEQDYASDIHEQGKRVYVFGRFNLSEAANEGDTLTLRPIAADSPLTVTLRPDAAFSGGKAVVFRNATRTAEWECEIDGKTRSIEFIPQNTSCLLMRVSGVEDLSPAERQQEEFSRERESAVAHLEAIEEEYGKDYASLEKELEELRSRMTADASVIEYYKDRDIRPIEDILREIGAKLDEAEEQIRVFAEARQRKTMEIENEIKASGAPKK